MKDTTLKTLYARREPSNDPIAKRYRGPDFTEVALYKDPRAKYEFARFDVLSRHQPRTNAKTVTIDCWQYRLHWLKPLQ